MKYLREVSDIHLDFDVSKWHRSMRFADPGEVKLSCDMDLLWYPEAMDGDDDTCLILAGDIWLGRKMLKRKHPYTQKSWIAMVAERFKYVVFVLGNHDYWSQNVHVEPGRIHDELCSQGLQDKVFFLEKSSVVLDQVKFVGGTLWTSYDRNNPIVMLQARSTMNDYKYIRARSSYAKVQPKDLLKIHVDTKNFIFETVSRDYPEQKVVVVTHMAPSYRSIHPRYRMGRTIANHFYYSDLDAEIDLMSHDIDLWFHGHCHCVSDYEIGSTRIICNPRGYNGHEDTSWNPHLRIEL